MTPNERVVIGNGYWAHPLHNELGLVVPLREALRISPNYPVPAILTAIDRLQYMAGYLGMLQCIVRVPFRVSEWYE